MKKTLSIHLGRQLFVIEEDAYDRLQQYLQRLEQSLEGETGIAEIIEDIEMRFAELLSSYMGETRKVVTISDVEQGASSLGEPEDFTEDTHTNHEKRTETSSEPAGGRADRRLFRDTENGMLGGVCSGLSAYLHLDPVLVRIIFVVLLFTGFGVPLYLLLWLIVPNALTPSERLQMQGKAVTVEALKEEFVKATERVKNDTLRARDRFQAGSGRAFNRAKYFTSIIGRIVGMFILGITFFWLTFFTLTVTGIIDIIPVTGDEEYASFFDFMRLIMPGGQTFGLFQTAVILVGFSAPVIAILIGIRLVMQQSHRIIRLNLIIFPFILFAGLIIGLISGLQASRDYAVYQDEEHQHLMVNTENLIVEELPHFNNNHQVVSSGGVDFIHITHNRIEEQGIHIKYRPSGDSLFHIHQVMSAHGVDKTAASQRSGRINHTIRLEGQKLLIDPYYYYPSRDGLRDQEVEIIIEVPKNKKLSINKVDMEYPDGEYNGEFCSNTPFQSWRW